MCLIWFLRPRKALRPKSVGAMPCLHACIVPRHRGKRLTGLAHSCSWFLSNLFFRVRPQAVRGHCCTPPAQMQGKWRDIKRCQLHLVINEACIEGRQLHQGVELSFQQQLVMLSFLRVRTILSLPYLCNKTSPVKPFRAGCAVSLCLQ